MKRKRVVCLICAGFLCLTGCARNLFPEADDEDIKTVSQMEIQYGQELEQLSDLALKYQGVYEEARKKNSLNTEETKKKIMDAVSGAGYPVVDINNRIDMRHNGKMKKFCEKVRRWAKGDQTVFLVTDDGGLISYHFTTAKGKVDVVCTNLSWKNLKKAEPSFVGAYQAVFWDYTQEGYLLFERKLPEGYDGPSGHVAIRVNTLKTEYRQLTAKYLDPIGYEGNNMFFVDWSQEDYGQLCFEDLYSNLYEMRSATPVNVQPGETKAIEGGALNTLYEYYFNVTPEVLAQKIPYNGDSGNYEWTRRSEFPPTVMPYPEVVNEEKNEDGTIKLTVNAVWAEKNTDKAFTHELTIQTEGEKFKYLSNRVVPSTDNKMPPYIEQETK